MYLLFDIGGTNMRLALSKDGQSIGDPIICDTPADDFDAGIKQIVATAAKLTDKSNIEAVAGGIPGPLNKEKTMVLNAPNIPAWNNKPLKQRLEKELDAKVFLENDTAMIGLGEAIAGAGVSHDIVVYITVSTGVGGARIVKGIIDKNSLGFEPGHQIISAPPYEGGEGGGVNIPTCNCGGVGHLEALISGSALEKKYKMHPKKVKDPEVWEEAAYHLAVGLNNVLVMWSPDIVLLGGAMMRDIPIDRVRHHLRDIVKIFAEIPPIEMMALGEKAGFYGSLAFLKHKLSVI